MKIGSHVLGNGHPCFIVAELGANHNGDLDTAIRMIEAAQGAGVDAVKIQCRTPSLAIPPAQQATIRATPWGDMTYLDYRTKLELSENALAELAVAAVECGLILFASAWDVPALERCVLALDPPCVKIPSACLTDDGLLRAAARSRLPIFLSTGMSTSEQIAHAVDVLDLAEVASDDWRRRSDRLLLFACKSAYPTPTDDLNLASIRTLHRAYGGPVGWSGHEPGGVWLPTLEAVVMGALAVERHFTLDKTAWGTDQSASLEPHEFAQLVRAIREWERARGDGTIRVLDSEKPILDKLRRCK